MQVMDSVLKMKNYGHIELKLGFYMDEHGITRGALARAIDTRFEVVDKWYNGDVEKLDLDILARICFVLQCPVEALLEYKEETNNTLGT